MVIKILLLILSFLVVTNIALVAISAIFNVNLYKKYGRIIVIFYGALLLFMGAVYLIYSMLGFV